MRRAAVFALLLIGCSGTEPANQWRAVVDVAGGPLRFTLEFDLDKGTGQMCSGASCQALSGAAMDGDSLVLEIGDFAASIVAKPRNDSLIGAYRNVGNRGPRVIPFRAKRGNWPAETDIPSGLTGRWDVTYYNESGSTSPRVLQLGATPRGLEGTIISNTGDYGLFWGRAEPDSFSLAHFDGSFVYMLTGQIHGDSLEGLFHAGARTQRRWTAVRSQGEGHLRSPTELTQMKSPEPFAFSFPDLEGQLVSSTDERFRDKVVIVDVFGSWCPTCHEAAPSLVRFYEEYHDRGLEIVGLAYEVTGDSATDNALLRRYREKFGIEFPLLLAGINITSATAATLPQLEGFTAYPTTIFIGRDGSVRRIHAGFYGPATGAQHDRLIRDFSAFIESLLEEPA